MPRRKTTKDEIDKMRMMSEQPLQSHNIYDASGPWGKHSMHNDPNDWDYSFYDRFPDGVESGADISASEGGKKRKNTIKRRKSRKVRKSRKH
jgi:hypothetical protein